MKKLHLLFIIIALHGHLNSQVFVNRVYQDISANPIFNPVLNAFGVNWSKSITNTNNELITVGHTTVSGQGENLYLEKRGGGGNLIFSVNKNTSSSNSDYGIDVLEPSPGGDIYVCGVTDNNTSNNYDIIIYRYSSNGTLLDSAQFDNGLNNNDIVSALTVDGTGNIILAGSTQVSNGMYDYLALKYSSNLSFVNSNTYDYSGLDDAAIGLEINSINGNICVIGASASTSLTGEYAVAYFDGTSLGYLSDERSSIPGTALDQPLACCKNSSNEIFITGKVWNSTNFDIKTIKISSSYSLSWSSPIDIKGFDDAGNSIAVDPVSGNIIVGGYAKNANNVKELVCLRLDASTGTVISSHNQTSENNSGDAFIKAITTNTLGDVYFIGEEKGNSGKRQVLVGKIKSNGMQAWLRKVISTSFDVKASDIKLANDGVCVISIIDSSVAKYVETKYSEFVLDTNAVYSSSGKPIFKKNELIVRFLPTVLDSNAIDNKIGTANKTFANLNYFLKPTPYSQFINAINGECSECLIKAVKVFPDLTTTFTITTSRLGQNISVPDFWTTLLLQFPDNTNLQQVCQNLEGIPNIIAYSHPNFIGTSVLPTFPSAGPPTTVLATDPLYSFKQHSLHNFGTYPNSDINIDEAWSIYPAGCLSFVKGGIFDSGIEYRHEDFGYDGTNASSTKIINGWDFFQNSNLKQTNIPDNLGHGTAVAGIIGAIRENTIGIKGIAGGYYPNSNKGTSLYSLGIYPATSASTTLNFLADAIIKSALSNSLSYSYGLHFQNHSWTFDSIVAGGWYTDTNIVLLTEAVHYVNRLGVTFIMSRGNYGTNSPSLPSTIHDDWVLTVGGTGTDGDYNNGITNGENALSFGRGVDIGAPSSNSLILTTWKNSGGSQTTFTNYQTFNNTSAAAPHVSGVVALLMGYHNNQGGLNDYNNLAPEDCEEIIQHSASTPTTSGISIPNQYIGFGRLNAGKALRLIEFPYKTLYHFGTNTITPYTFTKSVYSNSDTIRLTEKYQNMANTWFTRGKYVVKTFEINATVNHGINSSTDSMMYYWARPSSSYVFPLFNSISKLLQPREKVLITNMNSTFASLKGYVYKVWDSLGNYKGWIPCDTSFAALYSGSNAKNTLMEYSIITKNIGLSVKENSMETRLINLFPNPSSNAQTIEIVTQKGCSCTIELFDIMGRLIKNVYNGRLDNGKNEIHCDVTKLPNSMYIYYIKTDSNVACKKFIKE